MIREISGVLQRETFSQRANTAVSTPQVCWLMDRTPPDLEHAVVLNDMERLQGARYVLPKRRHDWLLGRWVAKRLLSEMLGEMPHILQATSGAPFVVGHPELNVSISHSGDYAFCAALWNTRLGVDIEQVTPHTPEFIEDYFTSAERKLIQYAPDYMPTLLWSAKEAALKALHLGLRVDTRSVNIMPSAPATSLASGWQPLSADCGLHGTLSGWWRLMHNYVLTIAVQETERRPL